MKKQPLALIGSHDIMFSKIELAALNAGGKLEHCLAYKNLQQKFRNELASLSFTHKIDEKHSEVKVGKKGIGYRIYGTRKHEVAPLGKSLLDRLLNYFKADHTSSLLLPS